MRREYVAVDMETLDEIWRRHQRRMFVIAFLGLSVGVSIAMVAVLIVMRSLS